MQADGSPREHVWRLVQGFSEKKLKQLGQVRSRVFHA
jgi:hypothetical protein